MRLGLPKQKHVCSVHFLSSSIFVEKTKEDGSKVYFETDGGQIEQLFSGKNFSSGIMSGNVVYYGIVGNYEELALYLPAASREIKSEDKTYRIPLPSFIFYGFKKEYKIFAVKDERIASYMQLYQAPLSNVYEDGRICQGTARFPMCSKGNIEEAADILFSSTFNADLSFQRIAGKQGLKKFYSKISGLKTFPQEKLLLAHITLKELFKGGGHAD